MSIVINGESNTSIPAPIVKLSCFEIELKESVNCIKKYQFIEEVERGNLKYRNGFTEIRSLGKYRYTIRHIISNIYHVSNIEDMEVYVKNFLKLNGYN